MNEFMKTNGPHWHNWLLLTASSTRSFLEESKGKTIAPKTSFNPPPHFEPTKRMPHLSDPQLMASMRSAVADVSQTRSLLKTLGDRPDHEAVDAAKARLAEIDSMFLNDLDEIKLSDKVDLEEEKQKKAIERERQMHKTLISLDQMHQSYDKMLCEAEKRLEKLYESVNAGKQPLQDIDEGSSGVTEEVMEEVVAILSDAMSNGAERIDLSERRLPFLPEAFGKIRDSRFLITTDFAAMMRQELKNLG